jgi:glycosyltransferase involved in cell wall biosynthesis
MAREADQARVVRSQLRAADARAQVAALRVQIEPLRQERDRLAQELGLIRGSRAYRLALKVRRLSQRLRGHGDPGPWTPPADPTVSRHSPHDPGTPVVSVIIPVFNKGATLLESIASVFTQTLPTWELIVWDDGSTDPATIALLDGLASPGLVVVRADNQGVVAARNAALERSRGAYICCLDPDDLIAPTYLEKAVLLLETHPDTALVFPYQQSFEGSTDRWPVPDLHPKIISQQNSVPVCAVVRREAMLAAGGFNPAMHDGCEDWELWAHLAELGFAGRSLHEYLFQYRFSHGDGRDAEARPLFEDHRRRIMRLHPSLGNSPRPVRTEPWAADGAERLRSQPWSMPSGEGRPVVFFVPWLTAEGGAEAFLRTLARGLVADGRTVVFIATMDRPHLAQDGVPQFQEVTPYVYSLPGFLTPDLYLEFVRSIVWRLHLPVVANVGCPWLYDNLDDVRAACRGPAYVIDMLFNHLGHLPANVDNADLIDHTLVAHSSLQDLLVDYFEVPSDVTTVPVGIAASHGPAETRARRDRSRLPVVGWLGRMSEEKRPEWFVEMARALEGRAEFRMAGTGPLLTDIEASARGVAGLDVLGFVDDADDFLRSCDLLVNTSSIEGISVVVMEAIAAGIPVVVTDVGGMADLVEPGITGSLVDARAWQDVADAVQELLDGRLDDLTRSVRSTGLADRFTASVMVMAWSDILKQSERVSH